ncbi:serine carboxypeptidase-like 40 [Rhododendron vialii]|uniref:serine carboxypeptidase-like 40 n=1 Tax=Rhododendron vialii TaxID=182163 RepID=UPI00265F628A|nr:serine carboxypeptidase-like 40 [Rhododendron vialii]
MATKASAVLFFFLTISFFIPLTHAKKQTEALSQLYKAKLRKNSPVDKGRFGLIQDRNGPKVFPQEGMKERDRIDKLPGQPKAGFDQYGGYVTVNESAGRAFYYYFVEAQKAKHYLPLLLWLNGGPGCSSLAYGAMQELGPFRVHSDGKTLYKNPFAWNHAANVLFLESPAGVGFSYSNTTSDVTSGGDRTTSSDNYVFLLNWLERFSEYKNTEFYIGGESYAGHYVPQLAHTILHFNKLANKTLVNLKGIIIGNAVINDLTDNIGMVDYFGSHSLISDQAQLQIRKHCNFSDDDAAARSAECRSGLTEANRVFDDIDVYNIYGPVCFSPNLTAKPIKASVLNFDPCTDNYVHAYLNSPEVQKAMHANVTKISYDWEACSDVIQKWRDSPSTIIPLLQELMENEVRVWVFSGDTDGRVPVTSTKYSLNKMKLPVKTAWHPWFLNGEVGGYTEVYKGDLTFVTVRGAGHQVPSLSPPRALALISHFLAGTTLPNSTSIQHY